MKLLFSLLLPFLLISCSSTPPDSGPTYEAFRTSQKSTSTLAYTDQGSGKPLVLLHGVPTSSWLWRKVTPGLSTKHRVITIDLLGYGSSAKPKNSSSNYTAQNQARLVKSLLRKIGVHDYTLGVHDMGGLVGWELMRIDQPRIANLVVFNTIVRDEGFNQPGTLVKSLSGTYSNSLTSSAMLKMTFKNLGLKGPTSLSERECQGYVTPLRKSNGHAMNAFFAGLNPTLFRRLETNTAVFQKFKGRTLILWGAKDKILTTAQIPFLQKHLRIPQENIKIYPSGGHFLMEENPTEIVTQITAFLR